MKQLFEYRSSLKLTVKSILESKKDDDQIIRDLIDIYSQYRMSLDNYFLRLIDKYQDLDNIGEITTIEGFVLIIESPKYKNSLHMNERFADYVKLKKDPLPF